MQISRNSGSLGRSVLIHTRGGNGESQWVVLLDLFGAAFGIIPVVPPDGIPSATDKDLESPVGRKNET